MRFLVPSLFKRLSRDVVCLFVCVLELLLIGLPGLHDSISLSPAGNTSEVPARIVFGEMIPDCESLLIIPRAQLLRWLPKHLQRHVCIRVVINHVRLHAESCTLHWM